MIAHDAYKDKNDEVNVLRSSFRIVVAAQLIVFLTLYTVRFVFAGTSVNPNANLWVGILETLLVLSAGYAGGKSVQAARRGDPQAYDRAAWYASFLWLVSVLLMIYQWRSLGLVVSNHYAQSYYLVTGFWMLYAFVAFLLFWAMRIRNRRIPFSSENHWDAEAVTTFGVVPLVAWVATFVIMYIV